MGRPTSPGERTVVGRLDSRAEGVAKLNVWYRANSNFLFASRRIIPEVGEFDETLGAGSDTPWGAADDTEYPLRAITQGFSILYDSHLTIYHPDPIVKYAASHAGVPFLMEPE
jgi:hypothetical protein